MPYTKRPSRARALSVSLFAAVLLSGAAPAFAAACPPNPLSQPFASLGDNASYAPVEGGTFEAGAPGWQVGGSEVISELVAATHGRHALVIAPRSHVLSAPFCVSGEYPSFRFMLRALHGSGKLRVGLLWTDADGESNYTSVASVEATSSWSASPVLGLASNLPLSEASRSIEPVRLVFSTYRGGVPIAISDVYIDPYSR